MRQDHVLGSFGSNPMEANMRFSYDVDFDIDKFIDIAVTASDGGRLPFLKIDARRVMGMKIKKSTYTKDEYPVRSMLLIVAKCRLEGTPLSDRKMEIINLAV